MSEDLFHLGIKAIIKDGDGNILVLENNSNRTNATNPPHWDLPGGRVKKGGGIEETLAREVAEEVGISKIKTITLLDVSLSKFRVHKNNKSFGLILITYLCEISNPKQVKLIDDEHSRFGWFSPKKSAEVLRTKFSDSLVEKVKRL